MADCYVTPTLLNSWGYYLKSFDTYEDSAKEDFINLLNKVRIPPTEAMQRGIDYENTIYDVEKKKIDCEDPVINEIVELVSGGIWQPAVSKEIQVQDLNILLYGKCDVIKENIIYDIKRVKSYDIGKYLGSTQHNLYLTCSNIPTFKYLVSDGKNLYIEEYNITRKTEDELVGRVNELISWLKVNNFIDIYLEKWQKHKVYGRR